MMRRLCCLTLWVVLVGTSSAFAQPTSRPVDPMPDAVLDRVVKTELGDKFVAGDVARYRQAVDLLDAYFATAGTRPATVEKIEALNLDANIVGRLCRIRREWAAMAPGVYYINLRVGPHDVIYFVGIPAGYDRTKSWPLVVKLPDADAFLTTPPPTPEQVQKIYSGWMVDELTAHPDAVCVMPLLNLDELYGPSYAGMNSVIQPMLHVGSVANIDPAKVYIMGHGMGAHAALNLGLHYTTMFTGLEALAGSARAEWQMLRVQNLRNVLPVLWHDSSDKVVPIRSADTIVTLLRKLKYDVEFEQTKNVGHVPSPEIVERNYVKMRVRVRDLYPQQVVLASNRPDTIFNRSDWLQVFQGLDSGDVQRVLLGHGSGVMYVYQNSMKIDGTLAGNNRIDIKSSNVQSMRIYLNDQMINFKQAVIVSVNGKVRFEDAVKPDVREMLKDQVFLGRGLRYFSGHIDIDFGEEKPSTRPTTSPASNSSPRSETTPRPPVPRP